MSNRAIGLVGLALTLLGVVFILDTGLTRGQALGILSLVWGQNISRDFPLFPRKDSE